VRLTYARRWSLFASCLVVAWVAEPAPAALAQRAGFVAPPRTIADITAILEQERPDPAKRAKAEADASAEPPASADRAKLRDFYFRRAQARAGIGRLAEAVTDCEKAVANSSDYVNEGSVIENYQEILMRHNGKHKEAIALLNKMAQRLNVSTTNKGRAFGINLRTAALLSQARSWPNFQPYLSNAEGNVEAGKGLLFSARGRFREAETAFSKAEGLRRDALVKSRSWPLKFTQSQFEIGIDFMAADAGMAKSAQGRHAEAEVDVRRALLSRLRSVGKYHIDTANMLDRFSWVLMEQARVKESEALARASIEILDTIGYRRDTGTYVFALNRLSAALFLQQRYNEAKESYATSDAALKAWSPERRIRYRTTWARIFAHYYSGEVDKGIAFAREAYERDKAVKGDKHYNTASSRATLAAGLAFAGRDAEAMQEYAGAIPVLLGATSEADDEDATVRLSADRRLEVVLEAYIALLARSNTPNSAEEGLRVVEAMRSRSVQNALSASAVRAAARTPVLADIVRREQDLHKRVLAQAGLLNNVLTEAPEQRDAGTLKELQQELEKLRKDRQDARREIERRFPEFARLTSPGPVAADDIRAALKTDEALLSFYFGRRESFVWAVPKEGPVAFAQVRLKAKQFESKIAALREALDPSIETIADIPAFDVAAAHEVYNLLLKPVEQGWRPAKNLIVVTNGALGMLPLGLLPTEPAKIEAKVEGEAYFASYRKVAWLARTHATVTLPSVGALRTLRGIPALTANRKQIIGFGDPFFNAEQAREAVALPAGIVADEVRGAVKIKLRASPRTRQFRSANLGSLPRLPDTAEELKSVAAALHADPAKVLHLGKDANEKTVKGLDLSLYRIVAFATHGLVPGDLDGQTQAALALTAPEVAGIDGDGLLTVDKILGLKLNADWVVLSACNTGAGAGAGADAVSGLGRAFFYAGTRALLVTNWSVHSASARELVTDVFRRQADNPTLTRMEALRQAMVALMEGGEAKDAAGKTLYTYAHPLFWAPYTIVGDGG
jgi:CHAT domain-containing protein/tetratricopeptide (TPR) repeat protein